jgi:hypothetical protein
MKNGPRVAHNARTKGNVRRNAFEGATGYLQRPFPLGYGQKVRVKWSMCRTCTEFCDRAIAYEKVSYLDRSSSEQGRERPNETLHDVPHDEERHPRNDGRTTLSIPVVLAARIFLTPPLPPKKLTRFVFLCRKSGRHATGKDV